jgi:hypothetical protein
MSSANAEWLYGQLSKGDVVDFTGSSGKPMEQSGNGYGDWNLDWNAWLGGSASGAVNT